MLILAVGVPLALFVWRQNVLREQSQTENLPFLHSLGAAAMTGIDLSDEDGGTHKTIIYSAALGAFSDAIHSTEIYEPNHPWYTRNFVAALTLTDAASRRYQLRTIFPADDTIYLDSPHGGSGKSKALYSWMRAQSQACHTSFFPGQAVSSQRVTSAESNDRTSASKRDRAVDWPS
jgi:hypothetical protein